MKAIYINPTEEFEASLAGEPVALISIGVWRHKPKDPVTLSFETSVGGEHGDLSHFSVCVGDAQELIEALQKAAGEQ